MTNKEITKEQKRISKELRLLSEDYKKKGVKNAHNKARCEINKKYGKFWRENLEIRKSFKENDLNMNYK